MDILVITSGVIVFLCISYLLVTVLFIAEKKLISPSYGKSNGLD